MGLFSFFKRSGKKVAEDEATPTAEALKKEVADLGLDAEGVEISVEGDTVKLAGAAGNDELKEKLILAVGNIDGVAAVEDNTSGAGSEPVFHTVEKGDTLWAIAEKTMGNGSKYQEIFEANKPMLSHPDKIYPGQVLRIPQ
ncbi:peptidoglycan-binding protein LysM [Aliishimia ponticola]|uniref:Potassium binding protein Kbp n=1 Tax=Aliishimia ponticola TaxID=2499833 RepID=A0A4S4NIE3_9RHOB|nr:peptidoglycan-binding protein LysM [Aliishimia ponticola]THH35870.1 peptidoglycan-binding protein LysM [Aliishimia ponticola]